MEDNIIIEFSRNNTATDVEIPKSVTADELIIALNSGFDLGIDVENPKTYLFRAENPIALIKGDITIEELGLRNGTVIYFEE